MKENFDYPFAAVVGEEQVKRGLLCALVNPRLSSIVISGPRGCGKTVLMRGLRQLMPGLPTVVLPLNATEDRAFGGVDFERTLREGEKSFLDGLTVAANGGLLLADDFHLQRNEITQGLWQVLSNGYLQLERAGTSERHDARFLLVAALTPEESDLDSAALDRFALAVGCQAADEVEKRCEIIRRRLAFEEDADAFWRQWYDQTETLVGQIRSAKRLIASVEASDAMLQLCVQKTKEAGCPGNYAEIFLIEAARSLAALAERTYVLPDDVEEAALYVLWHRQRTAPNCAPQETPRESDIQEPQEPKSENRPEQPDQTDPPFLPTERPGEGQTEPQEDNNEPDNDKDGENQPDNKRQNQSEAQDETAPVGRTLPLRLLFDQDNRDRGVRKGCGKRTRTRTDKKQGRYVRAGNCSQADFVDLAVDATLRAAAPAQRARGRAEGETLIVRRDDFRQKIREKRTGATFVFVVDASGSMGAKKRMSAVKGAILTLLLDAYQKRDRVAFVAFRRQKAEVLLPVTRSIELAQRCLAQLPTGGRTPLAEGIAQGGEVLRQILRQDNAADPVLILITDGRANQVTDGDPVQEAITAANDVALMGCRSLVLDTETDWPRLGSAGEIAQKLGAAYRTLDEISAGNIIRLIRAI